MSTEMMGDPSNLSITVDVADDDSGNVVVTATADNATQYWFYMGDGTDDPFVNTTGVYEHTYETLGTYLIEVRAYGSSGRFIKASQQVAVQSGDPVAVGEGYVSPLEYEGMELVWNDEFEGSFLNTSNWTFEEGGWGWGNQESQYYTPNNATIGGGVLTIEARKENYEGSEYTSSRIISQDKQSFQYGRVDFRAKLPQGQGIWPALWMLGDNFATSGWPRCGEIDIMEMIGGSGRENTVHGTCHWFVDGECNNGHCSEGKGTTLNSGTFSDEFHVFSIIWDENQIEFLVNNVPYNTFSIVDATRSEFRGKFFFIMNVAVGGVWPGYPDDSTVFPQQMQVDYVRVFQEI